MKNKILTIFIILQSFIIVGCVRPTPPVAIPVPPEMMESVVPHLHKVTNGIDSTIVSNNKLGTKIKDQKEQFKLQQLDIKETFKEAEELLIVLKGYSYVPENKITSVIEGLHKIETRNLFLETQNDELEAIHKEQSEILKSTKIDVTITYSKLMNKEAEANSLRDQNVFLGRNLQIKNNEAEALKTEVAKKKAQLATANVYKHWVWGLIGGFVAWTIIRNLLMLYFPRTKFRI